jgi:hypothetical protein
MTRIQAALNQTYTIVTNNGTLYSYAFGIDGVLTLPAKLAIKIGGFNGFFIHANSADRNYTFPNRAGNVALEDNTSLLAMLPALVNGAYLTNNGSTLSWAAPPNGSLTTLNGINAATYNAQTFATPGTTGTAPNWVSINNNTNTHTLHIPMASAANVTAGLISKTDYDRIAFKDATNTFSAIQTFANAPTITTPGIVGTAAATLQQVWDARNGIGIRPPVDAIDTTNYTTGLPVTAAIGGFTVAVGSRILFTNLTGSMAGYNNKVFKVASIGPTTWIGGTSTPTAELDGQAGTGAPTDGDLLFVRSGTNADQQWAYTGSAWVQYSSSASWVFGTGLTVAGANVSVAYGATGTTACVGNDARLSDSRTPLAHVLDGALHTISGKTAGQMLLATAATTFGFVTMSGDATLTGAGALSVISIGGVAVGNLGLVTYSATLADNTAAATLVTGGSWAIATYRAVRIEFSLSRGAGNYATGSLTLLQDGTSAWLTQNFEVEVGTLGVVFSVDINGGNLRLLYTTTSTGTAATLKFDTNLFAV